MVEIVATLEETYVAILVATLGDPTRLIALMAAFYPERGYDDWEGRNHLPTRPLSPGELCFSILHG